MDMTEVKNNIGDKKVIDSTLFANIIIKTNFDELRKLKLEEVYALLFKDKNDPSAPPGWSGWW